MLLRKCQELHRLHKGLMAVFILISEREKWMTRDIRRLLNAAALNPSQKKYLESLVQSVAEITKKLTRKVEKLQSEFGLVGVPFVLNGTVALQ